MDTKKERKAVQRKRDGTEVGSDPLRYQGSHLCRRDVYWDRIIVFSLERVSPQIAAERAFEAEEIAEEHATSLAYSRNRQDLS